MTAANGTDLATTERRRLVTALVDAYGGHVHRVLHDLAEVLAVSLAYVDRKTVEAHLERELTALEWQLFRSHFHAMDFDDYVGDLGTVRTDWIDAVVHKTTVASGRRSDLGEPS